METEIAESFCPHCSNKLEKRPQRKTKCKFCKNFIFVRTDPTTKSKVLVTEDQAKKIDLEWEKVYSKINWLPILQTYGVTEKDFEAHKAKMIAVSRQAVRDQDAVWSIFGSLANKYFKEQDFFNLGNVYYHQALFYNEEGRNPFHLLQSAAKFKLYEFKYQNQLHREDIRVCILSGDKSCPSCQKNNKTQYTIEEALKSNPIPCKDCSFILGNGKYPFCRCMYELTIVSDSENLPMRDENKIPPVKIKKTAGGLFNFVCAWVSSVIVISIGLGLTNSYFHFGFFVFLIGLTLIPSSGIFFRISEFEPKNETVKKWRWIVGGLFCISGLMNLSIFNIVLSFLSFYIGIKLIYKNISNSSTPKK